MKIGRRHFLQVMSVLPLLASVRVANATVTDLVLNCDTTLAPSMRSAAAAFAARTGIHVHVFSTPPDLILPQLAREIQNDLVITRQATIRRAEELNIISPDAARGAWRNPLVIAGRSDAKAADSHQRIAVSDPTPASDMDGPAIANRLNLKGTVMGVIDTDEVVDLLLRGEADIGLLHMTDVRANPSLTVVSQVPPAMAPEIIYSAAVTKLARRPNPIVFADFLTSPEAGRILAAQGLEAL
jgi:molybdate transport system substrate-binding protein